MKTGCIYIFLYLGFLNPLFGQSEKESKLLIGGGAGLNSSWLGGDISGKKSGLGYNAILSAGYLIKPFLTLQGSVRFVQITNSTRQPFDMTNPDYFIDKAYSSSWIEVPLTLEYLYLKRNKYSLFSGLGFTTTFLLQSKLTITTQTASGTMSATQDIGNQTTSFNLLPRINSGFILPLSENHNLVISIYYQLGVKNFAEESLQDSRLNVIGMDLQFNFKLK